MMMTMVLVGVQSVAEFTDYIGLISNRDETSGQRLTAGFMRHKRSTKVQR